MIIPTIPNILRTQEPRPETPMERTTREVRVRLGDEAQKRQAKTVGLRKARLEREAAALIKITAPKSRTAHNSRQVKLKS